MGNGDSLSGLEQRDSLSLFLYLLPTTARQLDGPFIAFRRVSSTHRWLPGLVAHFYLVVKGMGLGFAQIWI